MISGCGFPPPPQQLGNCVFLLCALETFEKACKNCKCRFFPFHCWISCGHCHTSTYGKKRNEILGCRKKMQVQFSKKLQVQIRFVRILHCFQKTAPAVFQKTVSAVFFLADQPHGFPLVISSLGHQGNEGTSGC